MVKDEKEKKLSMENFCLKLFKMRHKMDQYKHVELNHIYSNEPKVKI